jgi:hypothetical protein
VADRILVIDYDENRREHLIGRLRAGLSDVEVFGLVTRRPEAKDVDHTRLHELRANSYDMIIGHIGGNPSGYECLRAFKAQNPKGRAILYTKQDSIPLAQLDGLKLANAVVKRAQDDRMVFANDAEMLEVVNRVRKEPGLVHWHSPFRDRAVLLTIIPLASAVIGLFAAVVKFFGGG